MREILAGILHVETEHALTSCDSYTQSSSPEIGRGAWAAVIVRSLSSWVMRTHGDSAVWRAHLGQPGGARRCAMSLPGQATRTGNERGIPCLDSAYHSSAVTAHELDSRQMPGDGRPSIMIRLYRPRYSPRLSTSSRALLTSECPSIHAGYCPRESAFHSMLATLWSSIQWPTRLGNGPTRVGAVFHSRDCLFGLHCYDIKRGVITGCRSHECTDTRRDTSRDVFRDNQPSVRPNDPVQERRQHILTMVQAAPIENGSGQADGDTTGHPADMAEHQEVITPNPSTLPGPDASWAVTLRDKVIAITGANRGIGLGIAEVALANHAKVVYSFDLMDPSDDFHALAERNPGRFKHLRMDVTDEDSVKEAVDEIVGAEGAIHGMVCNAGMTKHQPALDFTMAQVEQLFRLNVFGAWACATAAARKFIQLGVKGSIVFTASMTSYRPNRAAPSAPYGGTKAAVRNMTHTLAMEWAPHGIRVNSISPGFVKTAMTYYVETAPDWDTKMRYYGGMPRLALPQELGGAYVYLLSDQASYTTGIDIPIAGIVGAW